MKLKSVVVPVVVLSAFVAPAMADLDWKFASFNKISKGGFSYNHDWNVNVVASGSFRDQILGDGILGVQKTGGDGIPNEVQGNFAFYGVVDYEDSGALTWAMANPNARFALEMGLHTVSFEPSTGPASNPANQIRYFALDGRDTGVNLTTTFNELAGWGYTEVADGVWVDIGLSPDYPGQVALSVVIEKFTNALMTPLDALEGVVAEGPLVGVIGNWRASGISIAPIPAPGAAALGFLGLGIMGWLKRRLA